MFLTDFSIKVKGLALAKQRQLEEYKATYAQQVVMMMMIMNGNGDDVDGYDDDDGDNDDSDNDGNDGDRNDDDGINIRTYSLNDHHNIV